MNVCCNCWGYGTWVLKVRFIAQIVTGLLRSDLYDFMFIVSIYFYFLDNIEQTMKKKKNKMKGGRGIVKKKSFLENQKKHKDKIKRALVDPSLKEDDTRVRFENFSTQVSGIEGSIVYQLAGRGSIQVIRRERKPSSKCNCLRIKPTLPQPAFVTFHF